MPLFLSLVAKSGAALVDLFTIVRCDANLGSNTVAGNNLFDAVTYAKSVAGAGQDRIQALVGLAANVSIHALTTGSTIPDGMGGMVPINLVGGATFPPAASPPFASLIQVAYCFDNQMFAFDAGGAMISLPRSVILFHELSHAFHRANGTFNAGDPEFQAETDENLYRAQVGLSLRDPNNHNGGEGASNGQVVPTCTGMPPQPPGGTSSCCSC
jgi:hypothetical protein